MDTRDFCDICSKSYIEGRIKDKNKDTERNRVEKNLRYSMLNYIEELEPKPIIPNTNTNSLPLNQRSSINQNNIETINILGQTLRDNIYRKSTIALALTLFGFFLFPFPYLGIFSLGFEIIGLGLALNSRRTEPSNWRQKVAIIGALIYIAIFSFSLIYLLLNPEMIAELIAELEAQGYEFT